MLGKAQRLFIKKRQLNGVDANFIERSGAPQWPFLEKLLEKEVLHFFDYSLAERLLRYTVQFHEDVAALICYLSAALRDGHPYVQIKVETFFPDLQNIFVALTKDELFTLKELILKGIKQTPRYLLETNLTEYVKSPICQQGNLFFFQKNMKMFLK